MYNSQDIAERIKNAAAQNNCKLGDMFAELGISANTLHNMKTSMSKTDTFFLKIQVFCVYFRILQVWKRKNIAYLRFTSNY